MKKKLIVVLLITILLSNVLGIYIMNCSFATSDKEKIEKLQNNKIEESEKLKLEDKQKKNKENTAEESENVKLEKKQKDNEEKNNQENIIKKESENTKTLKAKNKSKRILEDGIYKIVMNDKNYSHLGIEIEKGLKEAGANAQLGLWENKEKNKFKIKYDTKDGYYEIESLSSGKMLDVAYAGMKNGTNVWQYDKNGSDAQKWEIEKKSDGSYNVISKLNGLCLDVEYGILEKGKNIQLYERNDTNAQKFNFVKLDNKPEKILEDGIYKIAIYDKNYSNLGIEIEKGLKEAGANAQLGLLENREKNKFKIKYDAKDGYYEIESLSSGKMLDVAYAGMKNGTNVWQYDKNGSDAQKWEITKKTDGSYNVISKLNGLCLDVEYGILEKGKNIQLYEENNTNAQKFNFVKVDNEPGKILEDGIYKIAIYDKNYSNLGIEIEKGLKEAGANAQLGLLENREKNKFKIKYDAKDGCYEIESLSSGKMLDVAYAGMKNGTNVWQYDKNGSDAQKWKITKKADGSYNVISKLNGLYLDVEYGIIEKGKNVQLYEGNGTNAQKFNFIKSKETKIEEGTYKIITASNQNISISINNDSIEQTANVELGDSNKNIVNEFNIKYDKGSYIISSINSGNVLDVAYAGMEKGTNIWQYENNGSLAQRWEIAQNADGTYSIISKLNGLYLDVEYGHIEKGKNVQLYEGNGTNAQKFKLVKQSIKTEKYQKEGTYKISTKLNETKVLDITGASKEDGARLQIWEYVNAMQQQFELIYKNGYYYIVNMNSQKAIQVCGNQINQYPLNYENENQKWILKPNGKYYSIISKSTNLSMDIPDYNASNGTGINLYSNHSGNNQLFKFENIGIVNIDENKYPGIKDKLEELKSKHPNWEFEILYTGLNFYDVVNGEYQRKRNCLVDTNTYQGEWIADNPYKSGNWYSASYKGIAYFMDTRNFFNDIDIFQFLDLNEYERNSVTLEGIQKQVKGTFLKNYAADINNASLKQNVNPYYVIARLFQEQGRNGTTIGTGMDGGDGKTYYNPFNIGAQVGNDYNTALAKAKEKGWDSMEKAIIGGIDFLKEAWLENYQNTLYQNKFDIDTRNGSSLFTHEYMQNLSAAYSEARILRNCYLDTNKVNSNFKFIIPVFENMPKEISQKPSNKTASVGPQDVKVTNVDSVVRIRKNADINSEILKEVPNGTHLLSMERAINGNWNHVVTDDGIIGYISGDYVQIIPDIIKCNIKKTVKTNDGSGIKIRIGPSIYVKQAGVLSDGTTVTTIDEKPYNIDGYEWDRIILDDGRQAYAPARYLK